MKGRRLGPMSLFLFTNIKPHGVWCLYKKTSAAKSNKTINFLCEKFILNHFFQQ